MALDRFYYDYSDDHEAYFVFDHKRGSEHVVATCDFRADAELVVGALNACFSTQTNSPAQTAVEPAPEGVNPDQEK